MSRTQCIWVFVVYFAFIVAFFTYAVLVGRRHDERDD